MNRSPGLVLAIVLVLAVAQLTRLLAPWTPHVVALVMAGLGMGAAELLARGGHAAGAGLGALHPLLDLPFMAALEIAGALIVGRPAARRR